MFDWIEDEEVRNKAIEEHNNQIKQVQEDVDSKINEAVTGLKSKNEELLGEKKKLQELADTFKDIDPVKAKEAMDILNQSEYAQMIKDGKIDEVIEKKSSAATQALQKVIDELNEKLNLTSEEGHKFKTLYQTKLIDDELRSAAAKAGVLPAAVDDILLRGKQVFSIGEDGQVEARDAAGNLLKNEAKLIVTPSVWVDGLKEAAPHYWPGSAGAGLGGSDNISDTDFTKKAAALLAKGDHEGYRKLRKKQKAA